MGARIVLVARDKTRADATLDRLHAVAAGALHTVHYADLSLMAQTKRVAAEIAAAEPRIDFFFPPPIGRQSLKTANLPSATSCGGPGSTSFLETSCPICG